MDAKSERPRLTLTLKAEASIWLEGHHLRLNFHRSRSQAAVIQQVPGSGRGIAIDEASVTIVSSTLEMNKAIGFGKMIKLV